MILNKFKKSVFLAVSLFILAAFMPQAAAQNSAAPAGREETPAGVKIYFFYGDGCPHCAKEEIFLSGLEQEYKNIKILRYEIWHNAENAKILAEKAKKLNLKLSGVPITIIGNKAIVGYESDGTTGVKIKRAINESLNNNTLIEPPDKLKVPLLGEINIKNFSLPILTIIIGAIDGFNPCAMWVLVFLISLLLGMKDRKKMWILGTAFIASSAAVYFFFLAAWLNLFLFIGFVIWIRIAVGVIAIGSGGYHLKEWWAGREAVCKVAHSKKRKMIFTKIKTIILEKKFLLSLIGIIILAAVVNLIELVCSAGLPAVYTQVLALADLPRWQHYFYLSLYIFVFMLDDLLVFTIAMATLREKTLTAGYTKWSNLVGGILMLIIGILLILKPGWLMFG